MIVMHDSNSDGMCGFVEMRDTDSGEVTRVAWSVTAGPQPRSQSGAIKLARGQLLLASEVRLKVFQREMAMARRDRLCR